MEERQRQSVFGKETIQRGVLKGSEASMVGAVSFSRKIWKILAIGIFTLRLFKW